MSSGKKKMKGRRDGNRLFALRALGSTNNHTRMYLEDGNLTDTSRVPSVMSRVETLHLSVTMKKANWYNDHWVIWDTVTINAIMKINAQWIMQVLSFNQGH